MCFLSLSIFRFSSVFVAVAFGICVIVCLVFLMFFLFYNFCVFGFVLFFKIGISVDLEKMLIYG